MTESPLQTLPTAPLSRTRIVDPAAVAAARGLSVAWARHQDEVRRAQRLRFDVFAREMGASLDTPLAGHDIDMFDDYCEHLLVRDIDTGAVVGTYRRRPAASAAPTATPSSTCATSTRCARAWWNWDAAACTPTTARAA
jgi:putative hemolysin